MRIREWLEILPQYLMLFPAVLSCYLPMRNQMRFSPARTAGLCLGVLIPFTLAGAWAQAAFRLRANAVFLPALPVFFLLCLTVYIIGIFFYYKARKELGAEKVFNSKELIVAAVILAGAIAAIVMLITGQITI